MRWYPIAILAAAFAAAVTMITMTIPAASAATGVANFVSPTVELTATKKKVAKKPKGKKTKTAKK